MQALFENPVYLVVGSGFITAILALMYHQTQDRRVLPFLVVAFLLTIAPIFLDGLVTTDREALRRTVNKMAAAVRQNDLEQTLLFVHPNEPAVYSRIENEMPTYEFSMCNVMGFSEVTVDADDPNLATVKFTVFVNVRAPRYGHEGVANRGVSLRFRKVGDDWKVVGYRHYPPNSRKTVFDNDW